MNNEQNILDALSKSKKPLSVLQLMARTQLGYMSIIYSLDRLYLKGKITKTLGEGRGNPLLIRLNEVAVQGGKI